MRALPTSARSPAPLPFMIEPSRRPLLRLLLTLAAVLALPGFAAAAVPRLVRVWLTSRVTLQALNDADLDLVTIKSPSYVDVLEWKGDDARLDALGARRTVLDENPGLTAARRSAAELAQRPAP